MNSGFGTAAEAGSINAKTRSRRENGARILIFQRLRPAGFQHLQPSTFNLQPPTSAPPRLRGKFDPGSVALGLIAAMVILSLGTISARANPVGGTVAQGSATFSSSGSQLTIATSDRAYINWQSFNIGVGQTTTFIQPSSTSLVWNHINDPNASQILGNLNANGYVVLQNQSGFYIGGQASISAHGLIMTTAPIPMPDLTSGGAWDFNTPPPTASIINYGAINVDRYGPVFLIADTVKNLGNISAPQGNIGLCAGKEVLVSERPDGRGLSAQVTLPQGSVDNSGRLVADAGSILLSAQVVNQGGLVQANSVRNNNGTIELFASDAINLGANSAIAARGDSQGASAGGLVTIKSGGSFSDQTGSTIDISGGLQGGNGGQLEISSGNLSGINSTINGKAAAGFFGGTLTVDPVNLTIDSSFASSLNAQIAGGLSQINLQADNKIELSTLWTLGAPAAPASLTLTAGNNIILDDGSGIKAPNNWSVNFFAGPQGLLSRPASGSDSILLNGSSFLQTQNGNINLWAANDVLVNGNAAASQGPNNSGIRTMNGGNISVTAEFGNVNSGSNPQGFKYNKTTAPYYTVSANLGGISTAAGGNVNIDAGGNVTSYLPNSSLTGPNATADGGTGAFGAQPGNVTIEAGGNVFGHYVLANGVGSISAGQNIGAATASQNVALSLVTGNWTLNAPGGNIYLQEVRNPNGVYNNLGSPASPNYHLFNYDPLAFVSLNAGIGVFLTGLSLPRANDPVPIVMPPSLYITAGAGGITLENSLSLFPSPFGNLQITTTGNLVGAPLDPTAPTPELIMSDSAQTHWVGTSTFGDSDHGTAPIEINNPEPATITVAGNMQNFILIADKQAQIKVGGDMIDCGLAAKNLHPSDVTSINVAGQILNRSPYSFVFLNQGISGVPEADLPPGSQNSWSTLLGLALNPTVMATFTVPADDLGNPAKWAADAAAGAPLGISVDAFTYNPGTGRLGYFGSMPANVLAALSQPLTVLRYGPNGYPIIDASGHLATDTVTWVDPATVHQLYTESQGAATQTGLGYRVGGPGTFDVNAGSISLGNAYGILSCGVGDIGGSFGYGNLAPLTPSGATLNVTVAGDLDMLTSTIASLGGGNVNVTSLGGSMDLGSQDLLFNTSRQVAFGIFSSGRSDVNVTAFGDIDINGSRIASFNGGNINVLSLQGSVNAGSGGTTFVNVPYAYVDPATGQAAVYPEEVFGSGIVANTLVNSKTPGAANQPGNITVETPRGDIIASQGGILQEALNGNVSAGPTVTLVAGTPAAGNSPGFAGNIDLGNSGVIGGTVNVTANGNVTGLVISRQDSSINAAQSFSGTVLSGGTANLAAGGTISGTIVGIGGINASGGQGVTATLLSQNVSVAGAQAQSTLGTTAAATSTSTSAAGEANQDTQQQVASDNTQKEDDNKNKKGRSVLIRRSRVTVLLPAI